MNAASAGNAAEIQRLLTLEPGLPTRVPRVYNRTATENAMQSGSAEAVALLLDAEEIRAPFSIKLRATDNPSHNTLMHMAAAYDQSPLLRLFLDRGGAVDTRDDAGRTPLHYAANYMPRYFNTTAPSAMKFLLERGAAPDAVDVNGQTPLLFGISSRKMNDERLEALLAAGANVNYPDAKGRTALHAVLEQGNYLLAKRLVTAGADWSAKDMNGLTPFAAGAKTGSTVAYELAGNTLREIKERQGIAAARRLLAADPGVAKLDGGKHGWGTILQNTSDLELMAALLDAGADPNAGSVLFGAQLPQAKLLLDRGADPNRVGADGVTPVLRALADSNAGVVELLLERGARLDVRDAFGGDATHYAALSYSSGKSRGRQMQMLLDRGLPLTMPAAITLGRIDDIRRMIADRPDCVNERLATHGYAPLHYAILHNRQDVVALLIEARADLNARTRDAAFRTPLDFALSYDRTASAAVLVKAGADLSQKTHGRTPLHAAASWRRDPSLVQLMIDHKADPNALDLEGNTPLHAACEHGNVEGADILLRSGANRDARNKRQQRPVDLINDGNRAPIKPLRSLFDRAEAP